MSEKKINYYYCPKCLDKTPIKDEFCQGEGLEGLKPGECFLCYMNMGLHSRFEQIGDCELTGAEITAFLEDPARKSDPRFDPEAYSKRVNWVPVNYDNLGKSTGVECPYCHSKKTRKISDLSKAVNTAIFGIFGNKRRYQWHCNSCGSDF